MCSYIIRESEKSRNARIILRADIKGAGWINTLLDGHLSNLQEALTRIPRDLAVFPPSVVFKSARLD